MIKYNLAIENAYAHVENKKVSASGNSGRVIVPKDWIGKKVTVILTEPLEEEK